MLLQHFIMLNHLLLTRKNFMASNKFEFDITQYRDNVNKLCESGVDFVDAILTVANDINIDIETLTPILKKDPEFKARLYMTAEKLNFFKN